MDGDIVVSGDELCPICRVGMKQTRDYGALAFICPSCGLEVIIQRVYKVKGAEEKIPHGAIDRKKLMDALERITKEAEEFRSKMLKENKDVAAVFFQGRISCATILEEMVLSGELDYRG